MFNHKIRNYFRFDPIKNDIACSWSYHGELIYSHLNSLAVSSDTGYNLFTVNSDKLDKIYEYKGGASHIVERLFSSSLVAVVSRNSLRKLLICHFKKGSEICNYSYASTILAVKLNRVRVVVCLEESLFIHNIKDMKVVHTIRDTPPNPTGLCCLSICSDHCYLAYPGSSTTGEVQIFDALNLHAKTMIAAHDSPLAALCFSPSGTKLATASEKGTVIRVFNVQDGTRLFEFRRGLKRYVSIASLSFSVCGTYLCSSSNTETVHVFKLEPPKEVPQQAEDSSWMGYLSKAMSAGTTYLPTQVTDVFSQGRACASVRLPFSGIRCSCAVTVSQQNTYLLVASQDGFLFIYKLDMTENGENTLIRQHNLCEHYELSITTEGGQSSPQTIPKPPAYENIEPFRSSSRSSPRAMPIHLEPAGGSYAGVLKGNPPGIMSGTDSDKLNEIMVATESPPRGGFQFNDDAEFPPVGNRSG